jgi:hypothetical protein
MYGPFASSHSGPLPGKNCIKIEEDDTDGWDNNYFCASKPGAHWSNAGAHATRRCTQIEETADPNSWSDNHLCVDPAWREHFTWSSAGPVTGPAGPVSGQRCIAWYEPSDPHTWSDNFLCWTDGPAVLPLKSVSVNLSNIEDKAFVWVGRKPLADNQAICQAHWTLSSGPGASTCDLTALARSRGLGHDVSFTIKFRNDYGFDSQGKAEVTADGASIWSRTKAKVWRHTGWFYRVVLKIDFISGTVTVLEQHECRDVWDCPN